MKVTVMEDILSRNDKLASENRERFSRGKIFAVNLIGTPGAGKTTILEKTLAALKGEMKIAVIEGDLFTSKDAERIEKLGIKVKQINTTGGCHLDASMVTAAIDEIGIEGIELLIIENVGNLVCPAEFDLGEDMKATVFSVTEGDDKPLKYPIIFKEAEAILLNKLDILPYTNFDLSKASDDLKKLNPTCSLFKVAATTGEGLSAWFDFLRGKVKSKGEKS